MCTGVCVCARKQTRVLIKHHFHYFTIFFARNGTEETDQMSQKNKTIVRSWASLSEHCCGYEKHNSSKKICGMTAETESNIIISCILKEDGNATISTPSRHIWLNHLWNCNVTTFKWRLRLSQSRKPTLTIIILNFTKMRSELCVNGNTVRRCQTKYTSTKKSRSVRR